MGCVNRSNHGRGVWMSGPGKWPGNPHNHRSNMLPMIFHQKEPPEASRLSSNLIDQIIEDIEGLVGKCFLF